jgi:PAS domain S-box-containing protein
VRKASPLLMRSLLRRTPSVPAPGAAAIAAVATPHDLLALAVAGANDGLWAWDTRSNWVYRSARVQDILGLPPRDLEAPARSWVEVLHPEDVEHYRAAVRALFKGEVARLECEYRVMHTDGSPRWLLDRAVALRDGHGRVSRMAGSISDITTRKQAEAALRDSEQRFRDYVATASDWYWETGPDHSFTMHPDISLTHGIDPNTRLSRKRWDVAVDVEEEPEKWQVHKAALERRETFRDFVYRTVNAKGEPRHVSVSGKPVFDQLGGFLGYRGSARDVTDTVQSSRDLRQAMLEAKAADAAKSTFLANMSHELRTPLNAILGFSEVISQELLGQLGNPRYRDYALDILNSGQHLLELINGILDMSKVEAGRLELRVDLVSLPRVVAGCLPLVRERAAEGAVTLDIALPDGLPELMADEIRLKQILLNLLTNGIKFTPRGGSVRVTAGVESDGWIALKVIDTGIGMSRDDIALARQPFHQIENSTTRRYEGTGLGLPLTERLVELHGGRLLIDSALGEGTTVTVRLPRGMAIAEAATDDAA